MATNGIHKQKIDKTVMEIGQESDFSPPCPVMEIRIPCKGKAAT
jgi:hypothetical protein